MDSLLRQNLRIELYIIKILPMLIALTYVINTILYFFDFNSFIIGYFSHLSVISWVFLWYTSKFFKFCVHHRVPLYYILISDLINFSDKVFNIPDNTMDLLRVHIIVLGVFVTVYIYNVIKYKKYVKHSKSNIAKNSRANR